MTKAISLSIARESGKTKTNGHSEFGGDMAELFQKVTPHLQQALVWPRFQLGTIVITPGAEKALEPDDVIEAIVRHGFGDWGDLCRQDRENNEYALLHEQRLFSRYHSRFDGTKFYVITEWNRSLTTVLLPEEY